MTRELARFVPARGRLIVMVAGLAVFTGLAGWALWMTPAGAWEGEGSSFLRLALWSVAVACPVYAIDLGLRLARGTPTMIATDDGLTLNSAFGASAVVPWHDIETIAPVEMGRKLWLGIYLRYPVQTLGRLGTGARLMLVKSHAEGVPNFAFRAIRLGTSPDTAAKTLERVWPKARPDSGSNRQAERRA